jgi:hypothetical protein
MQTASFANYFLARLEVEMVSIGQYHLCARVRQLGWRYGLDISQGADGHKPGGFHNAMGSMKQTSPGIAVAARFNFGKQKGGLGTQDW